MEEGEILSSEEELSQAAASVPVVKSHAQQYHRSSAPVPGLSDSDETSDDDSDSELRNLSNKKYRKTFNNQSQKDVFKNPLLKQPYLIKTEEFPPLPNAVKKRKVNNVWGSVVTEQTIVNELEGVDVIQKANIIDRDVESYSYNDDDFDKQVCAGGDVLEVEDVDNPFDDGDLEHVEKRTNPELRKENTFHRGDRENAKCRLGHRRNSDDANDLAGKDRTNLKRKAPVKERLGKKEGESLTKDYQLTEEEINTAAEIAFKLSEKNVEMIELVVANLGKESALKFLQMTNSIEETGGMMTKDESRRRTAGGVFLYLVRTDKTIPKETIAKIFQQQNDFHKKKMRKHKIAKRHQKERALKNEYEELKRDILEAKRLKDLEKRSQDMDVPKPDTMDVESDKTVDHRPVLSMATDDFLDDANICDIEVM